MSKSVAFESNEGHESREMSGKRVLGDEGNEDEEEIPKVTPAESLPISTVVSTVPATIDQFIHTPEFRSVPGDTLVRLRLATRAWRAGSLLFTMERITPGRTSMTRRRRRVR